MMVSITKEAIIQAILSRRYGALLDWEKPTVLSGVGPCHPRIFDFFDAHRVAAIEASEETLEEMSVSSLQERFDFRGNPQPGFELGESLLRGENLLLEAEEPVWFAGGFNVAGRTADFDHWVQMKTWTLQEALALSIGFEPCGDIFSGTERRPCNRDVVEFYGKRERLFVNNFTWEDGGLAVEGLCSWIEESQLVVPLELKLAYAKRFGWGLDTMNADLKTEDAPLSDARERKSLLRLVIAMAIGGYGYDPSASRSTIPKDIASDLDRLGLSMDLDTIRKYLREADATYPDAKFPVKGE